MSLTDPQPANPGPDSGHSPSGTAGPSAEAADTTALAEADAAAARLAATDRALADRCQTSGDHLAGLIAAGILEDAGTIRKLPAAMFPDWDPAMVQAVWDAALPVAYLAGQLSIRSRWTPDTLRRDRQVLADAGYVAMAGLVGRSASLYPPRHPADGEQLDPTAGAVRGGGHP